MVSEAPQLLDESSALDSHYLCFDHSELFFSFQPLRDAQKLCVWRGREKGSAVVEVVTAKSYDRSSPIVCEAATHTGLTEEPPSARVDTTPLSIHEWFHGRSFTVIEPDEATTVG